MYKIYSDMRMMFTNIKVGFETPKIFEFLSFCGTYVNTILL